MATKKFKKEDLQALVGMDDCEALEVVSNRISGSSRWSIQYDLIFKDKADGKFYATGYSRGATESQDESPFEHEPAMVECTEVRPVEKVVIVYERA